jgi:hypothetical protein
MTIANVIKIWTALALATICAGFAFSGCATRTIYVPPGEPVRLAAPIKNAPVWVRDAQGKWVRGRVTLQEGWYALPDPGPEK